MSDEEKQSDNSPRGLSQLDRIALRVVSAITIAGIITIFSTVYDTKTDIAIIKNDIGNMSKSFDGAIRRIESRVMNNEKAIQYIQQTRYSKDIAEKDSKIINYRIDENSKKINHLEQKINK